MLFSARLKSKIQILNSKITVHSPATRNEFLRLRLQGLSLASIGRQLHVSKPTLIAWSRQSQNEIEAGTFDHQQRVKQEIASSASDQLAELVRKRNALRQELLSRSLRDVPTEALETLAGELRQRIEHLESARNGDRPAHASAAAEAATAKAGSPSPPN